MFSRLAITVVALLAMSALANWIPGTLAQDTKPAAVSPQVPAPKTPADVTPPATGMVMHPAYAKAVATHAYIWGWPMVNQFNRRAVVGSVKEPGRPQGVVPAGPPHLTGPLLSAMILHKGIRDEKRCHPFVSGSPYDDERQ